MVDSLTKALRSERMGRVRMRIICIITSLAPVIFVGNYTLNHFYSNGAYFWDSGTFAFLSTYANSWPMWGPPIFNINYFSIHFHPIFYLTSGVHRLIWFIPPATYFSLLQGIWAGTLGRKCFCILCARFGSYKRFRASWLCRYRCHHNGFVRPHACCDRISPSGNRYSRSFAAFPRAPELRPPNGFALCASVLLASA